MMALLSISISLPISLLVDIVNSSHVPQHSGILGSECSWGVEGTPGCLLQNCRSGHTVELVWPDILPVIFEVCTLYWYWWDLHRNQPTSHSWPFYISSKNFGSWGGRLPSLPDSF